MTTKTRIQKAEQAVGMTKPAESILVLSPTGDGNYKTLDGRVFTPADLERMKGRTVIVGIDLAKFTGEAQ